MTAFFPVPFCSHSLMDRISDSGSDGLGSNPDGSTKNAFVGIYRPYRARKQARFCRRPCLFSYFVMFHEFGRASGNHRLVRIKTFSKGQTLTHNNLSGKTGSFTDKCHCLAIIWSTTKYFHPTANVNVNVNANL